LSHRGVDGNPTMGSESNADPSTFDDKEWIHSTFTFDGKKVFSIVHEEYHGWEHPGECAMQVFDPSCSDNALTLATSTNGGVTFTHATPPGQLVASVPYQYVPDTGPMGYFTPSNIVAR